MGNTILNVEDLQVTFRGRGQTLHPVRGISFTVDKGEILGIVGESGSGKSVAMKGILGILPENGRVTGRRVQLGDTDLLSLSEEACRRLRGSGMTMIFQDPMTALNPLLRIGKQLKEVIIRHQKLNRREAAERAADYLARVGISVPGQRMRQFPHEFSGGMRQRVLIAMALACEPMLLIADEPTTALDVTIQAQILELLRDLNEKYHMSIALITHDMGVVASMCHRIVILYGGLIMEKGTTDEIFYRPRHPYTKALLAAIPTPDLAEGQRLASIPGLPPSLAQLPEGCPFAERCPCVMERCTREIPGFTAFSDTQQAACFLNEGGRVDE